MNRELLLITGLQQYGLGNWQDVAEHVGTRYKEECEKHYLDTYINDRKSGKPCMPVSLSGRKGQTWMRLTFYMVANESQTGNLAR